MANSQNKFTNDGSFLEQFRKLQEQKQADKSKVNDVDSVPSVKHLKPIVGRMGGQKRKVPLKQSVKTVHKAFQDDSDSEEDERNTSKECHEDRRPSKRQSEDDFAKAISEAVARSKQAAKLATTSESTPQPQQAVGGVAGQKRRSRWEGGGGEDRAISEAIASFTGSSATLTPEQQRQLKDQQEMEALAAAIRAAAAQSKGRKHAKKEKYEYDSDEDVEGGTWEHKKRAKEMRDSEAKSDKLTFEGKGKHFIGDFLPPDELEKFQEKVQAVREDRAPDFSDYSKHKLTEENIGFQMLQQAGWTEGSGLGSKGEGIQAPINKGKQSFQQEGVGMEEVGEVVKEDDEFEVYRKRMMLAYRFRPNPLNNPRRPYY